MFDKGYLLVDPWAAHRNDAYVPEGLSSSRRPGQVRSWYFDLGASTWSQGLGGASQEWFCFGSSHAPVVVFAGSSDAPQVAANSASTAARCSSLSGGE